MEGCVFVRLLDTFGGMCVFVRLLDTVGGVCICEAVGYFWRGVYLSGCWILLEGCVFVSLLDTVGWMCICEAVGYCWMDVYITRENETFKVSRKVLRCIREIA